MLHHHAREIDAQADRYVAEGCRYAAWSGGSWSRPRRVVLAEVRDYLGPERWAARRWPP